MAREASGNVYESRGKVYARVRVEKARPHIALPTFRDKDAPETLARCELLVDVAARLRAAGISEELAIDAIRKLGAREAGKPLADALRGIDAICAGETRATSKLGSKLVSVRDVGDAWTSGELARAYPDHIKAKRSFEDDVTRLRLHIYDHIGDVPIGALKLDHAMLVLEKLSPDLRSATRRQVAQTLNRLVNIAVFPLRLRESSPLPRGWLPKVTGSRKSECLFPDEETRHMAKRSIPLAFRVFYGVLAREGFRASEAASLRWRDVDLDRGFLSLDKNKTDDPRSWPMAPGTARALRAWYAVEGEPTPDAYVFHDDHGKPIVRWVKIGENDKGEPILGPECTVRAEDYREHLKQAGIERERLLADDDVWEPTGLHELRGLFITTALANGRTESWVSERTGHKSSQMIERYRRRARNLLEADLRQRDLKPLDEAIPELASMGGERAAPPPSGGKAGRRRWKTTKKRAEQRRLLARARFQNPLPERACRFEPDLRYQAKRLSKSATTRWARRATSESPRDRAGSPTAGDLERSRSAAVVSR